MTQYIISIEDKKDNNVFKNLLKTLKFIPKIEVRNINEKIETKNKLDSEKTKDWTELAGIWGNYNISQEQIREKAWRMKT
jgi:hypothetical protein